MRLWGAPLHVAAGLVAVCTALACQNRSSGGRADSGADARRDTSATGDTGATSDANAPFDSTTIDDATAFDDSTTTPDSSTDAASCAGLKQVGESCTQNGQCCGYPALAQCGNGVCSATCNRNSDCPSGCCYALLVPGKGLCVTAQGSCLPATPGTDPTSLDTESGVSGTGCKLPGESCSGNADCCGYTASPRISGCMAVKNLGMLCAAECAAGADCRSGCCVPIWSSIDQLCLPYDTYCL
jgi:hypothetical protein